VALGTQPSPVIRELDERECWAYLQQHDLGRVAVAAGGDIGIYPVNYLADGGRIGFRTDPGAKLFELMLNSRVAFEADGQSEDTAWSVPATRRTCSPG
jgi:nitroimidazol reductase NimA-like FMN-containing flavoprotein (pyridoxamine 5'-phosphate oxidase superfamily)